MNKIFNFWPKYSIFEQNMSTKNIKYSKFRHKITVLSNLGQQIEKLTDDFLLLFNLFLFSRFFFQKVTKVFIYISSLYRIDKRESCIWWYSSRILTFLYSARRKQRTRKMLTAPNIGATELQPPSTTTGRKKIFDEIFENFFCFSRKIYFCAKIDTKNCSL